MSKPWKQAAAREFFIPEDEGATFLQHVDADQTTCRHIPADNLLILLMAFHLSI
jgi:hypothetical protein